MSVSLMRVLTKEKDWYVELDGAIISGSFRTRREARNAVFLHARSAGDGDPWGSMSLIDREYPSFYSVITNERIYHLGLGSSICDQGDEWADMLIDYQRARVSRS